MIGSYVVWQNIVCRNSVVESPNFENPKASDWPILLRCRHPPVRGSTFMLSSR